MYFFGPERRAGVDDFRDAVHDSDGLRIVNGYGERLWRPLRNPAERRDLGLRRREPARLRPDPARARLRALLRTPRRTTSCAPAPGSSPTTTGAQGAVMLVELPSGRRVHRQHRRLLAPGGAARRRLRATLRLPADLGPRQPEDAAARPRRRHPQRPLDPRRPRAGLRRRLRPRHDRLRRRVTPRLEASAGEVKGLSIAAAARRQPRPRRLPLRRRRRARRRVPPLARQRGRRKPPEIWLYRWSA